MNCGCKLIATVHGSSIEDLKQKPVLRTLLEERIFERYIVLNNLGRIETSTRSLIPGEPSCIRRIYIRPGTGRISRRAGHMGNTWLRLTGAALVIISCSGLGFYMAAQWNEHLKQWSI